MHNEQCHIKIVAAVSRKPLSWDGVKPHTSLEHVSPQAGIGWHVGIIGQMTATRGESLDRSRSLNQQQGLGTAATSDRLGLRPGPRCEVHLDEGGQSRR